MRKSDCPGLRYRKRKNGTRAAIWCCPPAAVRAGYSIKTLDMGECPPDELAGRCQRLYSEAIAFLGKARDPLGFDGTLGSLLKIYELHPSSSFHRLKPDTVRGYAGYLSRLSRAYGMRRIGSLTGLDIDRWHRVWREGDHLSGAKLALSILKAALSFGQSAGLKGCMELRAMISGLRLPGPRPRSEAPSAGHGLSQRSACLQPAI